MHYLLIAYTQRQHTAVGYASAFDLAICSFKMMLTT